MRRFFMENSPEIEPPIGLNCHGKVREREGAELSVLADKVLNLCSDPADVDISLGHMT